MTVEPVAVVRSTRRAIDDDHWGGVEATIELCDGTVLVVGAGAGAEIYNPARL